VACPFRRPELNIPRVSVPDLNAVHRSWRHLKGVSGLEVPTRAAFDHQLARARKDVGVFDPVMRVAPDQRPARYGYFHHDCFVAGHRTLKLTQRDQGLHPACLSEHHRASWLRSPQIGVKVCICDGNHAAAEPRSRGVGLWSWHFQLPLPTFARHVQDALNGAAVHPDLATDLAVCGGRLRASHLINRAQYSAWFD
jgi:hypothetical protein